ncbi:MAG: alanine--tRNA ligase [Oscillospiraceae bacterium]|nr:alanine--tRNA ligase [Oscillospiraceae bacterium]
MKKHGLNELREMFLSFFESKDHLRLPSFSLIPQNDASLLLINSGIAPMKPYFKGEQEPPRRRVCTCQKCIRTGDIENIGKTARHGTYFEMLGNFSFGDYFKKEAIAWCWEFLTSPQWVGIDPDRLYPSIYQDDDEAFEIWNKDIGIPAERIFRFGKADNFWEHGAGPCGPCSEVYFDRGEEFGCGKPDCTVGCDCDRYMEVWNNVFSQFDNDGNNNYTELSQKNIDTGMGLERLAVVCQGVNSLFDVDTVMNITNRVSELTGAYYGKSTNMDVSLRVITDHIRSATFMICDGVLPSNEGRGYVLRRLLRRAARHGKLLGVNEPFLYKVIDTVVKENEGQYPEVREKQGYITKVVKTEEENFAKTIDAGMRIFAERLEEHKAKGETVFSGADAFKLYDTYGFPIDLTIEMCADEDMSVDQDGFKALMEEQRVRARKAREALGDLGWAGLEFGKEIPDTAFVGYDADECQSKVLAIVVDGEMRAAALQGEDAIIVLDQTVMYAEMGGQVADHGMICADDTCFEVNNVLKNKGGKFMHYGKITAGEISLGDTVKVSIDTTRRAAIRRAHSATHLLHHALREVLGEHVNQAGSLVEPDFLRFDFTHFSAVEPEQLKRVEELVNTAILAGNTVDVREMSMDDAKKAGATALFGEKYGDVVRVVRMGDSMELCGGTHLDNTAKAGTFHIISEGSVASGVRRIEASTGLNTISALRDNERILNTLSAMFKSSPAELYNRVEQLSAELKEAKRVIDQFKAKESASGADNIIKNAKDIKGLHVATAKMDCCDANALRQLGDLIRDKDSSCVAVISTVNNGKISFQCVCSKEAIAKGIKAGDVIRNITAIVGGKGGGKPDSAMGGGSDVSKLDEALKAVESYVNEKVKE